MMKYEAEKSEQEVTNQKNEINFTAANSSHAKLIENEKQKTQVAITSRNNANEENGKLKQRINELDSTRADMEAKVKLAQSERLKATTD